MEERSKRSFGGLLIEEVKTLVVKTGLNRVSDVKGQMEKLGYKVIEVEKKGADFESGLNVFFVRVL